MSAIVGQRRWEIFVAAGFALLAGYAVAGGNAPVAIAVVTGTVAVAIAVDRPTAAAVAMAIAAAAFAGLKRGFPVPGLRASEILIVGAGALVLTHAPATRRGSRTPFVTWAALYVATTATLGTLDLLRLGQPFSADAVGKLIGPLEFLIMFVAVRACCGDQANRARAVRWILLAAVPVSGIAVLQALGVSSLRHFAQVYALDTDSTKSFHTIYRATGLVQSRPYPERVPDGHSHTRCRGSPRRQREGPVATCSASGVGSRRGRHGGSRHRDTGPRGAGRDDARGVAVRPGGSYCAQSRGCDQCGGHRARAGCSGAVSAGNYNDACIRTARSEPDGKWSVARERCVPRCGVDPRVLTHHRTQHSDRLWPGASPRCRLAIHRVAVRDAAPERRIATIGDLWVPQLVTVCRGSPRSADGRVWTV